MTDSYTLEDYYRAVYLCSSQTDFTLEEWESFFDTLSVSVEDKVGLLEATQYLERFQKDGVVVLKHIYPVDDSREFVDEFWEYMVSLPYKPSIKKKIIKLIDDIGIRKNPWDSYSKKQLSELREYYPMTGGFGALTLPPAFHMKGSWKARQDKVIVSVFQNLLGQDDIEVTLDRVSFKFPGQGETEFAHWDSDPWLWPDEPYEGLQGMLSLSQTSFKCMPGSNSDAFREEFIQQYHPSKRHDQYFIEESHDPMNLRKQIQSYPLGIGDLVVWSNRLLHEARKNDTDRIRYTFFISYYPKGSPNMESMRYYREQGVDYYEDRRQSYDTGKNPLTFPSGYPVRLYSMRAWTTGAATLPKFCNMFKDDCGLCNEEEYKSGKKKGQTHPIVVQWDPIELGLYTPPPLTELGEKILGGD